jgi:hypothetical protein
VRTSAYGRLTSLGQHLPSWPWGTQRTSHGETLIHDVGAHKGEDTEFYLKKGISRRRNGGDARILRIHQHRFSEYVKSGALSVVNRAVSNSPGDITFYVDDRVSEWGTTNQDWSERNKNFGAGVGRTLTTLTMFW